MNGKALQCPVLASNETRKSDVIKQNSAFLGSIW